MSAPTTVDLYAGAGGASTGLHTAGFLHLACVDYWEPAVQTLLAAGFPGQQADMHTTKYSGPRPDLCWASPPCQCWSTAGSRQGARDEKRNLWPATYDRLDEIQPTWFLAENVPGLLQHKAAADCGKGEDPQPLSCPACYFQHFILPQAQARFAWVEYWLLDAADYGVPQRRHRVILAGGPRAFGPPVPTHSQEALVYAKWITGTYWQEHGLPGPIGQPARDEARMLARWEKAGELPPEAGLLRWNTIRDALPELSAFGTATRNSGARNPGVPGPVDVPGVQPVAGGKALGGLYGWTGEGFPPKWHRTMGMDDPSDTIQGSGGGPTTKGGPRPPAVAVLDGGSNPRHPGDKRITNDLTDTPSTTIPASGSNCYPEVVVRKGGQPTKDYQHGLDGTAPGVTSKGDMLVGYGRAGSPEPLVRNPKHPELLLDPDELAHGLRSGGDGHSAPNLFVRHQSPSARTVQHALDEPTPAVSQKGTLYLEHGEQEGAFNPAYDEGRLDGPSPTVATTEVKGTRASAASGYTMHGGPDRASDAAWLATGRRRLTWAECAALQSFPEGYPFQGNITQKYTLVGNAVAPPVSYALGMALRAEMEKG